MPSQNHEPFDPTVCSRGISSNELKLIVQRHKKHSLFTRIACYEEFRGLLLLNIIIVTAPESLAVTLHNFLNLRILGLTDQLQWSMDNAKLLVLPAVDFQYMLSRHEWSS